MREPLHLRAGGTSVVVLLPDDHAPELFYWGPELSAGGAELLAAVVGSRPQHRVGDVDSPVPVSLLPTAAEGWTGAPAVEGHRHGRAFSPTFRLTNHVTAESRTVLDCLDVDAGLEIRIELEVLPSGLVRQRLTVTNVSDTMEEQYQLGALRATFPVPDDHDELLHATGRWMRERLPQRQPFTVGRMIRESRKGRPGADSPVVLIAGRSGFGFGRGDVRGIHLAWSGNSELAAERTVLRGSVLAGAELLLPGEIALSPGQHYSAPWLYASWGNGLDRLAHRFHQAVRADDRDTLPRPVVMNVWEAVYFEHDLGILTELAQLGAAVGAELYVLDDGWFRGRRDDRRALGDWEVDPAIWPDGLAPLIDVVHAEGMRFGIWIEPEMVSLDSDLARTHPDWILRPGRRLPPESRWQQVIDLSHPEAHAHILEVLDRLLTDLEIDYLKWDHNRDALEPGSSLTGTAAAHANTIALYALLDELHERHPGVLIENCASGGSRIDLEMLRRTHRTWISDTVDPIERVQIQRYTGLLVPVEMTGNDIGAPVSHTTGRWSAIDLRGTAALIGSLGIQCDLRGATPEDRAEIAEWVDRYKRLRPLLHSGDLVNLDSPDPALVVRGVIARDLSEAVLAFVQLATTEAPSAGRILIPGLDPEGQYRVNLDTDPRRLRTRAYTPSPWMVAGTRLSGRTLAFVGLEAPVLDPEQGFVVTLRRD